MSIEFWQNNKNNVRKNFDSECFSISLTHITRCLSRFHLNAHSISENHRTNDFAGAFIESLSIVNLKESKSTLVLLGLSESDDRSP